MPDHADIGLVVGATEPGDLLDIEMALYSHQRLEGNAALDGRDGTAVLRRHIGHEGDQPPPARTRHVLHDDVRLPGQMPAEMACEEPRIGIIRPSGAGTDIEVDLAAFEDVLGGGG